MYVWPDHFPDDCPLDGAIELEGLIYRFTNKREPKAKDFVSHYERSPDYSWEEPCLARGLSVYRTLVACEEMCSGVPALRKKYIAKATIEIPVGLIAKTESKNTDGHFTWWRSELPENVHSLFSHEGKCAESGS